MPWSFSANVIQPIRCLVMMGGPKAALDVKRYDGWIMQTLVARIDATMRITTHPRVWKEFDRWGSLSSQEAFSRDAEDRGRAKKRTGENGLEDSDSGDDEDQVWVGSLHPLASLIPTAALGEMPNVTLSEDNGVMVCKASAARTDSSGMLQITQLDIDSQKTNSGPRIRAGETLSRAAAICSRPRSRSYPSGGTHLSAGRSSSCEDVTMDTAGTMLEAAETDYDLEVVDLDGYAAAEGDAETDG